MVAGAPQYDFMNLIDYGAFGYVIKAYSIDKDELVAIKRTKKVGNKISREYGLLMELQNCDNIIKVHDIFYTINEDNQIYQNLVFEYVKYSLYDLIQSYIKEKKFIPIKRIKNIIKQILTAIDYCHQKNIIHRDLKTENIMINENDIIKIIDFGASKKIANNSKSNPYVVWKQYRAPELILGYKFYNGKIDIFAIGCILCELFTLTPLFKGELESLQLFEQFLILGTPNKEYYNNFDLPDSYKTYFENIKIKGIKNLHKILNKSKNYKKKDIKSANNLILNMLTFDIDKRFNASQCLAHKFFK